MNSPCFICKGACCETIAIPFKTATNETLEWLNMHNGIMAHKAGMRIDCKCMHLTTDGLCGIHDRRPQICRKFKIGSPACLSAINDRRIIKEPILKAIKEWMK